MSILNSGLVQLLKDNQGKNHANNPVKAEVKGDEATLYLYDAIVATQEEADWWGGVAAESFVKELRATTAPKINLRINSPGGDVFAARAIEAAIRGHSSEITAYVDGLAASAASFIAIAADSVQIAPGAFFMIHKAWTFDVGNADDFRKTVSFLDKIDESLAESYAEKTGISDKEIMSMMTEETWMDGNEAVEKGFADSLSGDTSKNCTSWDLSAYKNAPKPEPEPEKEPEASSLPPFSREKYERFSDYLKATTR